MPRQLKADTFEDCASPEVADNYRRLCCDKRVAEVARELERRSMTLKHIEILFRNIASLPRDWRWENEPWKQVLKRRIRLTKKLRDLAGEIANDPDLGGWCFQIAAEHMNAPDDLVQLSRIQFSDWTSRLHPQRLMRLRTLAQLVDEAARLLEPSDKPRIKMPTGEILSSAEFDRRRRPARKMPLESYALLAIFEMLTSYISFEMPKERAARAPNRETEILASVLLRTRIKPGTVTQLRKKQRRRYVREK